MKLKTNNRVFTNNGQVIVDDNAAVLAILRDPKIIELLNVQDETETFYNHWAKIYDYKELTNQQKNNTEKQWFMSNEYKGIDLDSFLLAKCNTDMEKKRVLEELAEYKIRNLEDFLRYIIYLVDTMEKNKVFWGLGRGSACASYVLFLIGIHSVDSIKYKLSVDEFLK